MQEDYLQIRNNHYLSAQPHWIAQFGETFIWLLVHTLAAGALTRARC